MNVTCRVCGTVQNVPPSRAAKYRTCSSRCSGHLRGGGPPIPRTCRYCGKVEVLSRSRAEHPYCSTDCYAASLRVAEEDRTPRDPEARRVSARGTKVARAHRLAGLPPRVGDLTTDQWKAILVAFGGLCAYCGNEAKPLTMDHVIPASKGGRHTVGNVVPACRFCNQSKKDKLIRPRFVPKDFDFIERELR